jgi:serine/threonine protein phosphatase PrpC
MPDPSPLETAEYRFVVSPSALDTGAFKPPTTALRVRFGAVSHTGKVRPKNEDHYLVSQFSRKQKILTTNVPDDQIPEHIGDDAYSMIVADGMGGMAAGDVASRLAITTGLKLFQKSPKWGFKINRKEARELLERVNAYLGEIDLAITQQSEGNRKFFGMGTTLTAAYSIGVDLFIIHVGDSRAYLFRNGVLCQLTRDHTVAQAMADAGYIAPEEVRRHNKRNVLTNFLGGHYGKVKADVRWLRLADGDRLLLCSDGLPDMVDDSSIGRILGARDKPHDAAQSLVEEALKRGGKDNVTVLIARYEIPTLAPSPPGDTQAHAHHVGETTDSIEPSHPLTLASTP